MSIKGRLLLAFLAIIATLSVASLVFFVVNIWTTQQYKSVSATMIAEFRLVDNTQILIDAFNTQVQSAGTDSTESQNRINQAKGEIEGLFLSLDNSIIDTRSKSDYLGFKASIKKFVAHLDDSLRRFEEGSIKDYFSDYNEANKLYGFVRDNGTALLFSQLKYTSSLRDTVDRTYLMGILFSLGALIELVLGSVFFAQRFARKLTSPLQDLSLVAEKIAGGDMQATIGAQLLEQQNEIGSLSNSFKTMISKLIENITKLNAAALTLEKQVQETGRSKSAILNLLEDIEEEKKKVDQLVILRTKELSEEKARLLASINSLPFGFVISDKDDVILLKNPAVQSILEVKGELKTLHDVSKYFEGLDLVGSCKECMVQSRAIELKDISYGKKFLRIFCAPVIEGPVTIGYVMLIEDITEAKVMERSRDEFFAVASHELRTPLTAIRGNADMILEMFADKIVDKDMKEMLQDIDSSSVRLIAIVNDFLEVSRLEQGKIEIKKENFAMTEIVDKVVRDLKEMISKKGLALLYSPPGSDMPMVSADKSRIEQVLVNLVGNSAKFTKEGNITISTQHTGAFLTVRVADTGTGISEHGQALLFRKFQQAGEQMLARDVSQSTGLGLYICRLIMQTMGGEIGLEKSELGKGSVFYFTVPAAS